VRTRTSYCSACPYIAAPAKVAVSSEFDASAAASEFHECTSAPMFATRDRKLVRLYVHIGASHPNT
jgi:hypothetical protein